MCNPALAGAIISGIGAGASQQSNVQNKKAAKSARDQGARNAKKLEDERRGDKEANTDARRRRSGKRRPLSTLLTGPGGVQSGANTAGRETLLG